MFVGSGKRKYLGAITILAGSLALSGCLSQDEQEQSAQVPTSGAPFTMPSTESWPFPVPSAPPKPSAPRSLPAGVDVEWANADSVAIAAAKIWFGWDTTRDTSPFDAALRASPLMTSGCQDRMIASAPTGGPGDDWTTLARAHARADVTAALGSEDRPPDRGERATRIVGVTQRFTADTRIPDRHVAAMVVLTRTDGRWLVGDINNGTCGVVAR